MKVAKRLCLLILAAKRGISLIRPCCFLRVSRLSEYGEPLTTPSCLGNLPGLGRGSHVVFVDWWLLFIVLITSADMCVELECLCNQLKSITSGGTAVVEK